MNARKLLTAVLAGTMLFSAAALADETENEIVKSYQDAVNTEKSDDEVVIALSSEPSVIYDSAAGTVENEAEILSSAIMDTLVYFNYGTGELEPRLATEWEWTDATHLKFTLRDDVIMSDGTLLVADDVVYTCNEIWVALNQANDTGKHIVGAVAEDEHTVTIEFVTEAPDYTVMLSWPGFGITTEEEIAAAGGVEAASKNPVIGSGRYKFKEWVNGQYILLERNEDYWDPDYAGYFKTVKFIFISDASAREMAVEAGDADIAYEIPVAQAAIYAQKEEVNTSIYSPSSGIAHLWYNMGENAGATADLRVRQAIDKALNFDAISKIGSAGYSEEVLSYFDSGCSFHSENYTEEDRAVDIEGAKALLAEAGYEDGLELRGVTLSKNAEIFTVIQANLDAIGIKMTLETPDTAQYVQCAFGGDYDIMMAGDACSVRTPATVMTVLQSLNVNGPGVAFGGPKWTTDEIDSLITALITEKDNDKATEIALELSNIVKDQMICSNLYQEKTSCVLAKDIKGFCTLVRGYVDVTTLYK